VNQGIDGELTLVSAHAGVGKTTLLADWLASAQTCKGAHHI
jgi:ATP/maltotriose-dependent transcriptional regulator MalT